MKYQYYGKYVSAAEKVLANLPEVFTAKEFDEIRTPIRDEADDKWHYQTMRELEKILGDKPAWGYHRYHPTYRKWCEERDKAFKEYQDSIPASLQTLRKHGFVTVDRKEFITIIVEPSPWQMVETTYYYDDEEVSEKIYNKMKKYEPEKCRKVSGNETDTFRYYYRVDWNALNTYLSGDTTKEGQEILSTIAELEERIAELRKERKEKCPHWND